MKNKLYVAGSGISIVGHITHEVLGLIREATKVLYLFADPLTEIWLKKNNSDSENLYQYYETGKDRNEAYEKMVVRIMQCIEKEKLLLVLFYGHPGVFVKPSFEAIRRAQEAGFYAKMLPGVSAEDCIFSDLLFDPAIRGCASFEATHFLLYKPQIEPSAYLIIWQIGVVGDITHTVKTKVNKALSLVVERLSEYYPDNHEVILYEASVYPVTEPRIDKILLKDLVVAELNAITTLVIPPKERKAADMKTVKYLGITTTPLNTELLPE